MPPDPRVVSARTVIEAVRDLGKDIAGIGLPPIVGVLRPLVPEIADLLPPAPAPLDDRAAERHRVFRALIEVLAAACPAVLVLEDLHWADEQPVDFVGYLISQAPAGLSVVLTYRGDEVDHRVRSATAKLPHSTSRTEVVLHPLDERQTGMLAAAIVGGDGLDDEVESLTRQLTGSPRVFIDVEVAAGCLSLARGDVTAAQQRLTAAAERTEQLGGFDLLPIPTAALLRLSVARGDLDVAAKLSARLVAAVESKQVWPSAMRAVPAITEALLATDGTDGTRVFVSRSADAVRSLDAPLAPAALEHARGLIGRTAEQHRDAADRLAAAARRYESVGCPYEAALAREQAALCLFAAGDDQAAGPALQAALNAFRGLVATWDAGRAAKLARRHSVHVPGRHRGGRRGYGDELSPREREVAELAATGRTNKEIASELFLSVNTVARHISAAMRKLDARSRTALAHRLADHSGDKVNKIWP